VLLNVGRTDEASIGSSRPRASTLSTLNWFHWQMGWALYEKNDCGAALTAMRKMARIPSGAHRMLAGIHACLGNEREAKEALTVFLKDSPGDSISKQRKQWEKNYTAPGSLERWIGHMRFAGLPE
jgi:adenylate cyclase